MRQRELSPTSRRPSFFLTFLVIPLLVVGVAMPGGADPDSWAASTIPRSNKFPKTPSKISSSLSAQVAAAAIDSEDAATPVDVKVRISERPDVLSERASALGGSVSFAGENLLWLEIPAGKIAAIAALDGVEWVTAAAIPYALGDVSEGVATMQAQEWVENGATGEGINVAIVDLGFAGYQGAINNGDLPAVEKKNFCGSGHFNDDPHGTGVAEIVHDTAPDASLHLICVNTEADLGKAVDYAIANGVDVINHSVGWWNTGRGDGSGEPGTPEWNAGRAVEAGIVWVQASGNHAQKHWKGQYDDASGDGFHEFDPGLDETNAFLLGPFQTVAVFLKWNRWPTTSLDYDLGLYDHTIQDFVAVSADTQDGSQQPIEQLVYTNLTGGVRVLGVAIDHFSGNGNPRMDLFITTDEFQYQVKAGSIVEPGGHPDVITVGATCWSDDDLASYSSRGPNPNGVIKPDLTAPTGVTTRAYGAGDASCTSGFTGTSSASPHAAGMAALVLSSDGSLDPHEVLDRLAIHTIDLGDVGPDNRYGVGRINARGLCDGEVPTIIGTDGNDHLDGTSGADIIHGYDGSDEINGKKGKDLICGGDGDDDLDGGSAGDELRGGNGDDLLHGGTGPDKLYGGADDDTASYRKADGSIEVDLEGESSSGADGNDVLKSIANVIGSNFDDTIKGDAGPNHLEGRDGADTIRGRDGDDMLEGGKRGDDIEGGKGDDDIRGQSGKDILDGQSGHDDLYGGSSADVLVGSTGKDTLEGGTGADELNGDAGADTLLGGDGDDILRGGDHNDHLEGQAGEDQLFGGKGDDYLSGGGKADILNGQSGDDTLDGGTSPDTLNGSSGNDLLIGGSADDIIDGSAGTDAVSYLDAGGGVVVSLLTGIVTGAWGADTLAAVENIIGSLFGDELTGDDSPNLIESMDGDDAVNGLGGDDTLDGGPGTDTADGGDGTDSCVNFENLTACE